MEAKTKTVKNFIKVIDPDLAEKLKGLGFSYILDGDTVAFIETDELNFVLQHEFSDAEHICDNKLRF